jgi:hypothetical protein
MGIIDGMRQRSPSTIRGTLKDLRARAADLFRGQAGVAVLVNNPGRFSPQQIADNLETIKSMSDRKELRALLANLRSYVDSMRAEYGVKIKHDEITALLQRIHQSITCGQACYMPVAMLAEVFSYHSQLNLPPHARISLDPLCVARDYPGSFEVRILEASLYEDMCALFNLSQEHYATIPTTQPPGAMDRKLAAKRHLALMRATLSAAFYFVESFVNGLATNYLYNHAGAISEKDRMMLTEWDSSKRRYRFVTTRDKLIHYPRLVTGARFPRSMRTITLSFATCHHREGFS